MRHFRRRIEDESPRRVNALGLLMVLFALVFFWPLIWVAKPYGAVILGPSGSPVVRPGAGGDS
jgi:hypothetical protein